MKFNKSQRLGLLILVVVIVILQTIIFSVDFYAKKIDAPTQTKLVEYYNDKLDSTSSELNKKENKKYFKFNPNKLSAKYWAYFGLSVEQVYVLDSFRAIEKFQTKEQVKEILKIDDSIFDAISEYMYFASKRLIKPKKHSKVFSVFNPNKLDELGWMNLGFSKKQANAILRYKESIGEFEKVEELKKIFVISNEKYLELEPYAYIPNTEQKKATINTATLSDFAKIKTIGASRAKYIVQYREALGGFKYYKQLLELKSIDVENLKQIKMHISIDKNYEVNKININTATLKQLKSHPYISWKLANKIIDFRENFRKFNSVEELKNIDDISDMYFNKIKVYLAVK